MPYMDVALVTVPAGSFVVRCVKVDEILDLRIKAFPDISPALLRFDSDDIRVTSHVAMFSGKPHALPVCCASFTLSRFDDTGRLGWQVRAVSTDPSLQRQGLGKELLAEGMQIITRHSSFNLFWCNALHTAIPFYEKQGWQFVTDFFDIPGVGPHRKMMKVLPAV